MQLLKRIVEWRKESKVKLKGLAAMMAILSASLLSSAQSDWRQKVKEELPLMGHRNWIVIVDSAYPLQTSPGIETIETDADELQVLDYVLSALKNSKHVSPIVHTDRELEFVPENEAPGVAEFRAALKKRIAGFPADSQLHQSLIEKLNETGKDFHVLVLKTTMTIPYSSVFLQLDCKYWNAESEARLREMMKQAR
jgi:L-fucose mutarotase/ribose pyranase (RbsD/FucU family)